MRHIYAILAAAAVLCFWAALAVGLGFKHLGGFVGMAFMWFTAFVVWRAVLGKSKHETRTTIASEGTATQMPKPALIPSFLRDFRTRTSSVVSDDEEAAYSEARTEIDTGKFRSGLWAKVCCEEADVERQKTLYTQYRVLQILHERSLARSHAVRVRLLEIFAHCFQIFADWYSFFAKRIAICAATVLGVIIFLRFAQFDTDDPFFIVVADLMILVFPPAYLFFATRREWRRRKSKSTATSSKA